jgi:transposase
MSSFAVSSSGATCWHSSRSCRRVWLVSRPAHRRIIGRASWALGHTVRLMPPAYVKPYVKRHKNDAVDAEAICEAVTRANMRFVATKTPEQQSCLTLHRTRHLFIRQQTSVINAIRAHLAEFGIVAPVGRNGVEQLLGVAADSNDERLPEVARAYVAALGAQLLTLKAQILEFDRMIRGLAPLQRCKPATGRYTRRRSDVGDCSGCQCR